MDNYIAIITDGKEEFEKEIDGRNEVDALRKVLLYLDKKEKVEQIKTKMNG